MVKQAEMEKKHVPEKITSFDRIRSIFERINGKEDAKTLDRYANRISHYYKSVTLGELEANLREVLIVLWI